MRRWSNIKKLLDADIRAKNLRALRFEIRGLLWDLSRPRVPDPLFVVGCSRSGTTLTYETLAASSRLLSLGVEIPEFWNGLYGPLNNGWHSEAAGAEQARPAHRAAALRYFFQRLGKGWVLDKTCINTLRIPYLHRLFPQARFVFIQRDGRDNISSMIDGWRLGRRDGGFGLSQFFGPSPEPVAINGGEFREWHFFLPPHWRDYNRATLEEVCAYQWTTANRMALEAKESIPPEQWIQIRYEDVFDQPVAMFRDLFARLDLPFDGGIEARCRHLQPTSIVKGLPQKEKWRAHNPELIVRILPQIAEIQSALGYPS